jgi:NAD(P) transhydrogenase subunit alpha
MFNTDVLTIFILVCFVGYYVISKVTPSLHAPLMSVTNAISSIVIVVALDVVALDSLNSSNIESLSAWICIVAIFLTTINIVGGFMLTRRMLEMFAKKK